MKKAKIRIKHPSLGEFTSVFLNMEEDEEFINTVEKGFKNKELDHLSFNRVPDELNAQKSRISLNGKVLEESVLIIDFYK